MMGFTPTADSARGQWLGILLEIGLPEKALRDRHGPCPMCGGRDRFRFDNKGGNGTWICSHCGAGSGMDLVKEYLSVDFKTAAARVDAILGSGRPIRKSPAKTEWTDEQVREAKRALYARSRPIEEGDTAARYLAVRGFVGTDWPADLRTAPPDGTGYPSIVAMIRDAAGEPASLHQTYITPTGKAPIERPRRLARGKLTDGIAIRLSPVAPHLGVAEGIETALAATRLSGVPCWAALNTSMLSKWEPPQGCERVTIFADADAKFGGQCAAYLLAHRLAKAGVAVDVRVPEQIGQDWNDVLLARTESTLEEQT